jgi:type IX secretion system PorP/SprF family membrane protein
MKKILIIFILVLRVLQGLAQDHIYSQFYNSPNYLNPALNGQFEGDLRMSMVHRSQWTNLPGPLTYTTLSVDYNVPKFNGGIGLLATRSSEGTAYLNKINIAGIYSYSVEFDNGILSFGLQAGITSRQIDYDKLLFADQIDETTGIIPGASTGASIPIYNNRYFFDTGAGTNLVFGNLMAGLSMQHLNKPNESFTGSNSILPIRSNAYLSYKFKLGFNADEASPAIIPSVVLYKQGKSQSVSAGFQYKLRNINAGLWYRGDNQHGDAFVVSVILDIFVKRDYYDKIRLGVSHDATASKLSYSKTAGTTEIALNYETTFEGRSSRRGGYDRSNFGNRCYDFY